MVISELALAAEFDQQAGQEKFFHQQPRWQRLIAPVTASTRGTVWQAQVLGMTAALPRGIGKQ